MITNWPVTRKPYSICGENEKTSSSRKSGFRHKLQLMSPLKPTNIPPTDITVYVADRMIVLRLIQITTTQPLNFMKWADAVKMYLENLPGNTLHFVYDDYSTGNGSILKKGCPESITESEISDLSQQFPKSDECQDFLSNNNNKFQLTNLISDYLLEKASFSEDI